MHLINWHYVKIQDGHQFAYRAGDLTPSLKGRSFHTVRQRPCTIILISAWPLFDELLFKNLKLYVHIIEQKFGKIAPSISGRTGFPDPCKASEKCAVLRGSSRLGLKFMAFFYSVEMWALEISKIRKL